MVFSIWFCFIFYALCIGVRGGGFFAWIFFLAAHLFSVASPLFLLLNLTVGAYSLERLDLASSFNFSRDLSVIEDKYELKFDEFPEDL